ncbi:MAG: hypothetical protein MUO26_07910 [Methanotrichaceae archaeon]|nr:hypothetical protein [Methanotrichaceae archaeon]
MTATATIKSLDRRISMLEERAPPENDSNITNLVLSQSISNEEIALMEEHAMLAETGFNDTQISEMMQERYSQAQDAFDHFREAYQTVLQALKVSPPHGRGRPKSKSR